MDLIVDEEPKSISISCFDPIRQETAVIAINSLIKDGRIHPARIEELVDKALEMQLEAITITDHEYLTIPKKRDDNEIIQGIEVSASWDDLESFNLFAGVHLLIYFLEEESSITKHLEKIRNLKIERNEDILKKLNQEKIVNVDLYLKIYLNPGLFKWVHLENMKMLIG